MFSLLSPTLTWWEILSTKDIAAVQSEKLMKMISFLLLGENVFALQTNKEQKSDHKKNHLSKKTFMACSPPLYSRVRVLNKM